MADISGPYPSSLQPGDTARLQMWLLCCRPTAAHAAANDVVSRAVEAGAYLVAAPAGDVRLIMQMPRGNLETISPRALVLSGIASSLQARLSHALIGAISRAPTCQRFPAAHGGT